MERLVKDAQVMCEVTGKKIKTLAYVEHANINRILIGTDQITSYNFFQKGYYRLFEQLKDLLTEESQIQFFGCNIAGPNPYDPTANLANLENKVILSPEFQAFRARCMLSTISEITGATVFASSDSGAMGPVAIVPFLGVVSATPIDVALEFVIGPDGHQIPFNPSNQYPIWDTNIWNPDPRVADTPGPFCQYPGLWPASNIQTLGEDQSLEWARLSKTRWS
jgi:hypothetical protein